MFGAILGDIIGSPYEFDRGDKTKNFPLFSDNSCFTDDTVMTLAVGRAFLDVIDGDFNDLKIFNKIAERMREFAAMYPDAGYGGMFRQWLSDPAPQPYGSFGNGSAMRVSSVAWLYNTHFEVCHAARLSAITTHNDGRGIMGAEAVAAAIFMARTGSSKQEIKQHIEQEYHYDLSRTCDEIRPDYHHVETCMETVPEAIISFLEGKSFEDVIRNAVSLGGDTDTLAAIAGSIAEGFYGVPENLKSECKRRLPKPLLTVLEDFELYIAGHK